jgi:hypothetical protein
MNVLSWNCRGLGNLRTVRDLCRMVKEKRPALVFLMETKLRRKKMEFVRMKMGFPNMFVVDCVGKGGGLALLWDGGVEAEIQNFSQRHINVIIQEPNNGARWKLSGFYGHPDATKRVEAWSLLRNLAQMQPEPWVVVGDFNEVLFTSEKWGGCTRSERLMKDFRQVMEECELFDLGYRGPKFTWTNCREDGEFIKERLDRGIANDSWKELFPAAEVLVEASINSDHAPLILCCDAMKREGRRKPWFRYEANWALEEEGQQIITRAWQQNVPNHDPWKALDMRMKWCKEGLNLWQKEIKGRSRGVLTGLQNRIKFLQSREGPWNVEEIKNLQGEMNLLMEKEDLRWKQQAKEEWLKNGDRNTKYYHACVNSRRQKKKIWTICDEAGQQWESLAGVEEAFVSYFTNLFTAGPAGNMEPCLQHINQCVTLEMNTELMKEFRREEINIALNQMAPLKAPGPDGFNACFFQTNWATIGDEVCSVVLNILNSGVMPSELNMTHIALIPKKKDPLCVSDFRPISLCNVLYKIVSKVLANRLKKILPYIISPTQSAFLPGRLITDNILAAFETLHTMHTGMRGKKGFMAVKLDMSKAYDRVEWRFLEAVMKRMGFDSKWIKLIMMCVTSTQFAVLVNGNPCGKFFPSRGIRQGDPISPYLFILCAEALSSLLSQATQEGLLTGVPSSKRGPRISHLFFADDSLLFCRASMTQWTNLINILNVYEEASGQQMNQSKTSIFFSRNTLAIEKEEILAIAGVPATQRYDKYLGLPTLVGKSRTTAFKNIIERVWKRLQDWKIKFLSQAGKEILLKAVIQAIPTYCMSVFLFPKKLCNELNSLMKKFWWSSHGKEKGIHWMSWEKMGFSKSAGGMGFRDFISFNKALLAKQVWRMWKNPEGLVARIMRAKYHKDCSILEAQRGRKPSFAWRSIQNSCELVREGLIWRVGNGSSVRIWKDKWLPLPSTYMVHSPPVLLEPNATVGDLIDSDTKWWDISLLERMFTEEEIKAIQTVPLSRTNQPDMLIWRGTSTGEFTVKSAYHLQKNMTEVAGATCSNQGSKAHIWKFLWNLKVPNAEKNFLWRACHEILPTRDNLCRRKIITDSSCPLCGRESETAFHILWHCPSARDVWCVGNKRFQKCSFGGPDFMQVVEGLWRRCEEEEFCSFVGIARRIWLRRNDYVHGGVFSHPNEIVRRTTEAIEEYQRSQSKIVGSHGGDCNVSPWKAPSPGWFKINWDVAVSKEAGRIGVGVVIRDYCGKLCVAQCFPHRCSLEPTDAEALAAFYAVTLGRDYGFSKVILEGDTKVVVDSVNSDVADCSRRGHMIADIREGLREFQCWEIKYVRRTANNIAHVLARAAVQQGVEGIWTEIPPDCIVELLVAEQLALPRDE